MDLPKAPRNPNPSIEVPKDWARPILFMLVSGARGSGKSHVISQFVRAYMDHGAFTRVFLVSPSYHTNKHLWDFARIEPQDAYPELSQAEEAVRDVVRKVKEAKASYVQNKEHWRLWLESTPSGSPADPGRKPEAEAIRRAAAARAYRAHTTVSHPR
jgi:hypothetical protein